MGVRVAPLPLVLRCLSSPKSLPFCPFCVLWTFSNFSDLSVPSSSCPSVLLMNLKRGKLIIWMKTWKTVSCCPSQWSQSWRRWCRGSCKVCRGGGWEASGCCTWPRPSPADTRQTLGMSGLCHTRSSSAVPQSYIYSEAFTFQKQQYIVSYLCFRIISNPYLLL